MAHQVDPNHIAERVAVLEQLAKAWGKGANPRPEGLDELEGHEEFVAVALACERDSELLSPAAEFASLPWWLQAWVLRAWEMERLIGRRLGTPD